MNDTQAADPARQALERDFKNYTDGRVPGEVHNFNALVFYMVAKADLDNRERLRRGFPDHVQMYEDWMGSPAPEAHE